MEKNHVEELTRLAQLRRENGFRSELDNEENN